MALFFDYEWLFGTFLFMRWVPHMSLLDSLLDNEFLEKCLARNNKSCSPSSKGGLPLEEYCSSGTIEQDIEAIIRGENPFSAPKRVVSAVGGKQREFFCLDERAKCLFWLVVQAFRPYVEPYVSYCCSSALGPSAEDVFRSLSLVDEGRRNWVVLADVRNYTNSMTPGTVKQVLDSMIPGDARAQDFVLSALQPPTYIDGGVEKSDSVFIGTGTVLNSLLANTALSQADAVIAEKALVSTRFVDDALAVFECEEDARAALSGFREEVERLGFSLNESKNYVVSPGQAFDFIGLNVSEDGIDLSDSIYAQARAFFRQNTRALESQVRRGVLSPDMAMAMLAQGVNQILDNPEPISWVLPLLGLTTTDAGLRSLDRYLQDCMRRVGSGKAGPARYRISYECLKAHGYRSIVNWYYRNHSALS